MVRGFGSYTNGRSDRLSSGPIRIGGHIVGQIVMGSEWLYDMVVI